SSTQGASTIGSVSEEIEPSVVRTLGESVYATAATTRDPRLPMPRVSASRTMPQNPASSSSAHQTRWVTHAGRPSRSPSEKKLPCGKKYPYAWFWTWPIGAWLLHRCEARSRKPSGFCARSYFVSATVRPGACRKESRNAATTVPANQRLPSGAAPGRSKVSPRSAPRVPSVSADEAEVDDSAAAVLNAVQQRGVGIAATVDVRARVLGDRRGDTEDRDGADHGTGHSTRNPGNSKLHRGTPIRRDRLCRDRHTAGQPTA